MYLKSAVTRTLKKVWTKKKTLNLGTLTHPQNQWLTTSSPPPPPENNSTVPTYYSPLIIIWGLRGTWYEILRDVKVIQIYFNNTVMPTYLCQWFSMCKNDPETVLHCMNLKKIHTFEISKEGLQLFHSDTKAQKGLKVDCIQLVIWWPIWESRRLVPHLGELGYMYLSKKCSSPVVTKPSQITTPWFYA